MIRRTRTDSRLKTVALATNVLFALSLLPWALAGFVSFFLFDAPGSTESAPTVALAWSIWLYPLLVLSGCVLSFVFYRAKSYRWALGMCGLPAVGMLAMCVAALVLVAFCDGQLSCP